MDMKNHLKYSVIIPVYNAEKTLNRCVNSLLRQNYREAEIILVNDGSTDHSEEICKAFETSSQQIRYIYKENGGVSSARNAGLERAAGKYIVFVDSDDAVAEDYFFQLDILDCKGEYDFLWFSYKQVDQKKETECVFTSRDICSIHECAILFSEAFYRKTINSPWNKRFCNEIIRKYGLRFHEEISIGEDLVFNLQYALLCGNCRISDKILYSVYIDSQQSLSRKPRNDLPVQFRILDEVILRTIQTAEIEESDRERYLQAVNMKKIQTVYSEAKRMRIAGLDVRARRKRIHQMCGDISQINGKCPGNFRCCLLGIPVFLKLTAIIDWVGGMLAK